MMLSAEATFSFPYPEETIKYLPVGMPHDVSWRAYVEVDPELGRLN